jgi:hypothetical protein
MHACGDLLSGACLLIDACLLVGYGASRAGPDPEKLPVTIRLFGQHVVQACR